MKKILVTGGAGFLGSHLCERLLNDGHNVLCIDDLCSGNKDNIEHLLNNPNFDYVYHDINTPFYAKVEQIYNLACPASPIQYQSDPVRTIRTCVLGTTNMLELAKAAGARILQASTSEVYGDPDIHPQPESYWGNVNPIGMRSCYDEGKRVSESLMFNYHRQYGVDIKVVRLFNTYGPRMDMNDGRVVSNFIVQALKGEDITVYGEGTQTRSFCYVDDLIDGLIRMMNSRISFIGPVNLGNPGEFTIYELAKIILEMTGSESTINKQPLPLDDPIKRRPSIELAVKELGWKPFIPLRTGLEKTIDYFRQLLRV